MSAEQQQIVAYKRAYYDRGLEIERLNAKVAELEEMVKKLEKPPVKKATKEDK